jgi:predicted NUDIX family NTP pyrophosphohydrolase
MTKKRSAGLLMYRRRNERVEVLLAHPGGPYFRNKDQGSWTIPKGEPEEDEDLLAVAIREFTEETGITPEGPFVELESVRQKGGKVVHAWAFEGDCDLQAIVSNKVSIEWPPRSGQQVSFPEIDRAEFFELDRARQKINSGQARLLDLLAVVLTAERRQRS